MTVTQKMRALIADDERLMREQLRARLAEVWPELEIVAEAKNGLEAVALTEQHHPDIVFLDIRMPGLTGVEAARQIAQLPTFGDSSNEAWPGCEIVFITAYDQYAVEAFEQGVVDYVLKPAERERLTVTVSRIRARMAARRAGSDTSEVTGSATSILPAHTPEMQQLLQTLSRQLNPQAPPKLQWIQATVGQNIQMIPVEEVLFFISDEE
jgi:DNA-binding LytR/AlgR family response regulator